MSILFGENARKTGVYGDIAWSLQYVNGEESLCLARQISLTKAQSNQARPVVVVGLSSAHKYTAANKKELGWLIRACTAYVEYLGFEPSKFIVHRLIDLIQRMLIELVTMKPEPISKVKPKVELESIKDGKINLVLH